MANEAVTVHGWNTTRLNRALNDRPDKASTHPYRPRVTVIENEPECLVILSFNEEGSSTRYGLCSVTV